jgi:hypothetical protein
VTSPNAAVVTPTEFPIATVPEPLHAGLRQGFVEASAEGVEAN